MQEQVLNIHTGLGDQISQYAIVGKTHKFGLPILRFSGGSRNLGIIQTKRFPLENNRAHDPYCFELDHELAFAIREKQPLIHRLPLDLLTYHRPDWNKFSMEERIAVKSHVLYIDKPFVGLTIFNDEPTWVTSPVLGILESKPEGLYTPPLVFAGSREYWGEIQHGAMNACAFVIRKAFLRNDEDINFPTLQEVQSLFSFHQEILFDV